MIKCHHLPLCVFLWPLWDSMWLYCEFASTKTQITNMKYWTGGCTYISSSTAVHKQSNFRCRNEFVLHFILFVLWFFLRVTASLVVLCCAALQNIKSSNREFVLLCAGPTINSKLYFLKINRKHPVNSNKTKSVQVFLYYCFSTVTFYFYFSN